MGTSDSQGHQTMSAEDGKGVVLVPICCEGSTSGQAEKKTESLSPPSGLPSWPLTHPLLLKETSETQSFTNFSPCPSPGPHSIFVSVT